MGAVHCRSSPHDYCVQAAKAEMVAQRQRRGCSNALLWGRKPTLLAVSLLLLACLELSSASNMRLDAKLATSLSREIREEFRKTGFNWISPVMFREIDLSTNTKPFMFLFTMQSCEDCRLMLQGFGKENPTWISNLSAQFNAVLVLDDFILEFGPEYAPNGHDYTPRAIFADPDGTIRPDFKNSRSLPDALYHYGSAKEVLWSMIKVLKSYVDEQEPFPSDLPQDLPS